MANAKGTSPTMKKISQKLVQAIPFPSAVSLDEQLRIVSYLDGLERQGHALEDLQARTASRIAGLPLAMIVNTFQNRT
jgi:type I restriction enzyme S subunit